MEKLVSIGFAGFFGVMASVAFGLWQESNLAMVTLLNLLGFVGVMVDIVWGKK